MGDMLYRLQYQLFPGAGKFRKIFGQLAAHIFAI